MSKNENFLKKYEKEINAVGHAAQILQQNKQTNILREQVRITEQAERNRYKLEKYKLEMEAEEKQAEKRKWENQKLFAEAVSDMIMLMRGLEDNRTESFDFKYALYLIKKDIKKIDTYQEYVTDITALTKFKEIKAALTDLEEGKSDFQEISKTIVQLTNRGEQILNNQLFLDKRKSCTKEPYIITNIISLASELESSKNTFPKIIKDLQTELSPLKDLLLNIDGILEGNKMDRDTYDKVSQATYTATPPDYDTLNHIIGLVKDDQTEKDKILNKLEDDLENLNSIKDEFNELKKLHERIKKRKKEGFNVFKNDDEKKLFAKTPNFDTDLLELNRFALNKNEENKLNTIVNNYCELYLSTQKTFENEVDLPKIKINLSIFEGSFINQYSNKQGKTSGSPSLVSHTNNFEYYHKHEELIQELQGMINEINNDKITPIIEWANEIEREITRQGLKIDNYLKHRDNLIYNYPIVTYITSIFISVVIVYCIWLYLHEAAAVLFGLLSLIFIMVTGILYQEKTYKLKKYKAMKAAFEAG